MNTKRQPVIVYKPETIKEELEQLRIDNGGLLNPADVVEYAKNEETLLHARFNWDDSTAAEQYRLWQARKIISLELVVIGKQSQDRQELGLSAKPREPIRAYVSLVSDRGSEDGGYRTIEDVLSDEDLRNQLLEEAKKEMIVFKRKYSCLQELAKVFEAMETV